MSNSSFQYPPQPQLKEKSNLRGVLENLSMTSTTSTGSNRESKFPIPGEDPDSLRALLTDPDILLKQINQIAEMVFRKSITKEISDVRIQIFEFFDEVTKDTKQK